MESNDSELCLNIATNIEKESSPPKEVQLPKQKKTVVLKVGKPGFRKKITLLNKGKSSLVDKAKNKGVFKYSRKGLRKFTVTEQNSEESGDEEEKEEEEKDKNEDVFNIRQHMLMMPQSAPEKPLFSDTNFANFGLHPHMVANLRQNLGIDKLTTVQKLAIPVIASGKDALIRSQTGSGKTLAYAVPIIESLHVIRPKIRRVEGILAVIVVPSRELALQTYEWFVKLLKPYTWIVPGYLAGGEKRKSEKARLRRGVNILISTPGRLVDHACHTRNLQLQRVKYLVLDEADRMLEQGYEKDITSIVSALDKFQANIRYLSWEKDEGVGVYKDGDESSAADLQVRRRQTILLSATLTKGVYNLAGLTLKDPTKIDASGGDVEEDSFVVPQNITQWYVMVPPKLRLIVLAALIVWKCKMTREKKMLVFCATQDIVDFLTELLAQVLGTSSTGRFVKDDEDEGETHLVDVEFFKLHGNMSQKDRVDVFKSFREIEAGVLLCTDVASRGLDLPRVDWVLQWTAPPTPTDYVHRVGRTARGGHKGAAMLFLAPTEAPFLLELGKKGIRLKEESVDRCLQNLLSAGISVGLFERHEARTVETAATAVQLRLEDAVVGRQYLHQLGCKAFNSFVRFYAAYPKESRDAFSVRRLHLGHYAKGFALRDSPSAIGTMGGGMKKKDASESGGRLRFRDDAHQSDWSGNAERRSGGVGLKRKSSQWTTNESRTQMLLTSEYASGLDTKGRSKKSKKS